MARKIVNNTDPGTSTVFGGDDLDYVNKYLTGVDQTATDPVTIATTTTFKNSKLVLRNPADTFSYTIVPSAITGARNLTLPLLTADDTVVTTAATQTLTNKTLSALSSTTPNIGTYHYEVFKDGSTFYARNVSTGAIDSSNTDATVVIQYAVTNAGTGAIFIRAGLYVLGSTINVGSDVTVIGEVGQKTTLKANGDYPVFTVTSGSSHIYIRDLSLQHATATYSTGLIKITNPSHGLYVYGCNFYDNGTLKGACILVENTAAANAFVGIYDISIFGCFSFGFEAFVYQHITNASTSPSTGNWITDVNVLFTRCDAMVRVLKSVLADNSVVSNIDFVHCQVQTDANCAVAFDYDGGGYYSYCTHTNNIVWDLPAGINYANLGNMSDGLGGYNTISFIGCIPTPEIGKIGGSGFATVTVRTEYNPAALVNTFQSPIVKRTGFWIPTAGTTLSTVSTVGGMLSNHVITGAGSVSNTFSVVEGVLANFTTGATSGNAAGIVSPTGGVGVGRRLFGMRAAARVAMLDTANSKFLFGFTSNSTLPTAAATQPLAATDHGLIVGFVETGTGSTNWTIWHNDGATSVTADNVTGPIAKDANYHTIDISWLYSGDIRVMFDTTVQTISTDLPATTANLFFNCIGVTTTSLGKVLSLKGLWIEADK